MSTRSKQEASDDRVLDESGLEAKSESGTAPVPAASECVAAEPWMLLKENRASLHLP